MKKIVHILMALCLLFCFSACGGSETAADERSSAETQKNAISVTETPDEAETEVTEEAVEMTESYITGRQSYFDVTGIMLPEIADVTMADSSCFDAEYACFDITGAYETYTELMAFFTDHFGEAPQTGMNGELEKSFWTFVTDDGTDTYEVYWNSEGIIYINYFMSS